MNVKWPKESLVKWSDRGWQSDSWGTLTSVFREESSEKGAFELQYDLSETSSKQKGKNQERKWWGKKQYAHSIPVMTFH